MKTISAKAILIAASLFFPICCFAQTKSKEAAAYANSGIAKLKKNDFDGAIADLNRALQLDPKNPQAYESRGIAKREKHDLDGVIADFNRALQLDPKYAHAYYSRGNAKREKHELITYGGVEAFSPDHKVTAKEKADLQGAIADFNRALQLDPENAKAYGNRGIAKMEQGDCDGAIGDFDHVLTLDPKNAPAYEDRANAKRQKGDLGAAIVDYNRALELNPKVGAPKLSGAYAARGDAKLLNGQTDGAFTDFNRALGLDPKNAGAYAGRGSVNFLARNWTAALRDYKRFCGLSRRNQQYPRLAIWMIRSRLGEREEADKELAARFNAEPGSWPSKLQRYLLGNLSESEFLGAVSPDVKVDPGQRCEASFYAGMKNLLNGNRSAASEFFKKCLATEGNSVIEYQFAKAELKALGRQGG